VYSLALSAESNKLLMLMLVLMPRLLLATGVYDISASR